MKAILAGAIAAVLIVSALASVIIITGGPHSSPNPGGNGPVFGRAQSGLVASDPLNKYATQQQLQANGSYWSYGGTASSGAYYNFYQSAGKLNIGIVAPNSGEWSGFYAVTPPTSANLVHAVLTVTTTQVPGYYDNGLYMQSTNQLINYLTCLAITTPSGTTWGVVHGRGTTLQNVVITPLWVDTSPNQPTTRDCTLVTNGQSYIRVFLDNKEVFSSNSTNLGMPGPYNFFVEEESEFAGHILYGSYQDFYATVNDSVKVTGLPANAQSVALVGQHGEVYASGLVSGGSSTLYVGKYVYPISGYLRVYNSPSVHSNATQISTTPLERVYGGDVFKPGGSLPKSVSIGVTAQDTTGHDLNGFYVTLSQGRNVLSNGSTPWTFTNLNYSQTYAVTAYDFGSHVFDHWSDGSTSRVLEVSPAKSTNLVAVYRDSNSPPPAGQTSVTVTAMASSGAPITGLSVTVWRDGVLVGVSYTSANFDLTTGSTYLVAASSFGGYNFMHWNNGSNDTYYQLTPEGQTASLVATYSGS